MINNITDVAKIFKSDAVREAGKFLKKKLKEEDKHEKELQKIRKTKGEKAYREALKKSIKKMRKELGLENFSSPVRYDGLND